MNDNTEWLNKRITQCNFDTILQVISLRSQPEIVAMPTIHALQKKTYRNFGTNHQVVTEYWQFDFEVQHNSVFHDGNKPLALLYSDCEHVPMILIDNQIDTITPTLNTSRELKNIHFEVL